MKLKVKIRIKKEFTDNDKDYFLGEIYYATHEFAKNHFLKGNIEYLDIENIPYETEIIQDKVSIIIPIVDGLDYFEKCLKSLNKYTNNYELIVVSNGSKKETIEYLNSIDWINFTLIINKENMGFGYACNQGIKVAKCDYICLLNDDTILTPNWLPKLLKCFEINKDCGMVSPTTCSGGTEQCDKNLISKRFEMTEQDILNYANQLKNDYKISDIYGFCMLTKKSILDKVGVFDYKRYGIAGVDEKDLIWRMKQFDYKTYWAKGSYVHHYGHKTLEKMGMDAFKIFSKNEAIFEERKKDPNLFIENDTVIEDIKKIKAKRIDVIIPVLDRNEETIKTLDSLYENNKNINVIVVDNSSDDLSYLDKYDVKVIKNKENKGAIYAFNQGLDIAKSKYIVLMHNDVVMNTKNWINKAIKFMDENEEVGMVGLAGWKRMTETSYSVRDIVTAINRYNRKPDGEFEEVLTLDGLCNVVRNIGLRFDNVYGYMHYYDHDICLQYREKGYKLFVMRGNAIHFAESGRSSRFESKKYKDNIKKSDGDYFKERTQIFEKKWKNHLPLKFEPIPILMITWDRLEYTKKAIKAIKENTHHPYILWTWDNGSKDGTVEYLNSIKSDNIFVNLKDTNYGLVPPMNAFFDKFKNNKYVSKVDNDTVVSPYWLTKLKKVMDNLPLFVIQADHYLAITYKLKNNYQFYKELEGMDYRGEKLYLFPHVSGTGVLIRRKHIDKPIEVIKGKLSGWVNYQLQKSRTKNLRCGFYTGVWIDRLDQIGTNKYKKSSDYPEYDKKLNEMRSGNEKHTGVNCVDMNLKSLKEIKESMRVNWI